MKRILNSGRDHVLARVCVFLIVAALITGTVGCTEVPVVTLTITSTEGGSVTTPDEWTFTYNEGTVVDLVAEADEGYHFVNWTGNVSTIVDVEAASTNITMNGNYSITANFGIEMMHEGEIHDWYDFDAIRSNLGGSYILMNDLDSTTAGYEELAGPDGNEGMGWLPIGTENDAFAGSLDGQGYVLRDLFMIGSGFSHAGVFGFVDEGGQIEDIGVVDAEVFGHEFAGGLAAVCNGTVINSYSAASVDAHDCAGGLVGLCYGNVTDSYSTGSVTSDAHAGGLVGLCYGNVMNSYSTCTVIGGFIAVGGLEGANLGTVVNSYSTGSVTGYGAAIGGLVGSNGWSDGYSNSPGTVSDSYSTGIVTGEDYAGGLVGLNWPESIVSNSCATGNVDGEKEVGGLVGGNAGNVSNSYSTGSVNGYKYVGGLMGSHWEGTVDNSYSTGSVTGSNSSVGGLVGFIDEGDLNNSYSTGSVTGGEYVGGLVGLNEGGTVSGSFWDIETSGQATSDGGTGKNTIEMKSIVIFSGASWDITTVGGSGERNPMYIWNIVNGMTYPFLSWQPVS